MGQCISKDKKQARKERAEDEAHNENVQEAEVALEESAIQVEHSKPVPVSSPTREDVSEDEEDSIEIDTTTPPEDGRLNHKGKVVGGVPVMFSQTEWRAKMAKRQSQLAHESEQVESAEVEDLPSPDIAPDPQFNYEPYKPKEEADDENVEIDEEGMGYSAERHNIGIRTSIIEGYRVLPKQSITSQPHQEVTDDSSLDEEDYNRFEHVRLSQRDTRNQRLKQQRQEEQNIRPDSLADGHVSDSPEESGGEGPITASEEKRKSRQNEAEKRRSGFIHGDDESGKHLNEINRELHFNKKVGRDVLKEHERSEISKELIKRDNKKREAEKVASKEWGGGEISDEGLSSKLAARRSRIEYSEDEEPQTTKTNVVDYQDNAHGGVRVRLSGGLPLAPPKPSKKSPLEKGDQRSLGGGELPTPAVNGASDSHDVNANPRLSLEAGSETMKPSELREIAPVGTRLSAYGAPQGWKKAGTTQETELSKNPKFKKLRERTESETDEQVMDLSPSQVPLEIN